MFRKRFRKICFLILASFVTLISCSTGSNSNHLPQKLGDLNLDKVIQDEEANAIINKMHGKKLDDCENFIGYYGNSHINNILYVSVYDDAEKAKAAIMNMARKLAGGSSVFSPLTYSEMGKDVHFETEGMGFKHYFYRNGHILIWWQVEPDKAEAAYNDLVKFDFAVLNDRINKQ